MGKMTKGSGIVNWEVLYLKDQFDFIKEQIEQDEKFKNLRQICRFNKAKKTLRFQTEKIHPKCPKGNRIPVLMLFSNPHPNSVRNGMFLSEGNSRLFWQRLFNCHIFTPPDSLNFAIDSWSKNTCEVLEEHLLRGQYGIKTLLYFDCLEALPTNYYAHLNTLFPKRRKALRDLRKECLQDSGMKDLIELSKRNGISSWIVFSAEAYRHILKDRAVAKNAPQRICRAIDVFLQKEDSNEFWQALKDLRSNIVGKHGEITVYLSLIARAKNWKTHDNQRYFTLMLNRIFEDVQSEVKEGVC
jgi:hypothetical protein